MLFKYNDNFITLFIIKINKVKLQTSWEECEYYFQIKLMHKMGVFFSTFQLSLYNVIARKLDVVISLAHEKNIFEHRDPPYAPVCDTVYFNNQKSQHLKG